MLSRSSQSFHAHEWRPPWTVVGKTVWRGHLWQRQWRLHYLANPGLLPVGALAELGSSSLGIQVQGFCGRIQKHMFSKEGLDRFLLHLHKAPQDQGDCPHSRNLIFQLDFFFAHLTASAPQRAWQIVNHQCEVCLTIIWPKPTLLLWILLLRGIGSGVIRWAISQ